MSIPTARIGSKCRTRDRVELNRTSFLLRLEALDPPLRIPNDDGNACRYSGRDHRLRPLRRKVRRVREDIASERRYRADCYLPSKRVRGPIHLCKEDNRNNRADSPTNRSAEYVLETQCSQNIRARHHEKAGKPSPREFFGSRTDKPTRTQIGECKVTGLGTWHGSPFLSLRRYLHTINHRSYADTMGRIVILRSTSRI
jgi:hypothetical protein